MITFKDFFCENNDTDHEYSCTMAMVKPDQLGMFKKFAAGIEKKDLEENGIETDTHCTILYGTYTSDIDDIKNAIRDLGIDEIHMKLEGLSTFGPNDNGIVLKVGVISSDLRKLNKKLSKLPHTTDFPTYEPHITIAYLKPGTEKKYMQTDPFIGQELTTNTIVFSTADGTKTKFKLNEL